MVNPEHFEFSREELKARLKWYDKKYGPYIRNRGLRNWKNLFRKPSPTDWLILFMMVMALFIAWAYNHDIAMCREYIKQQQGEFTFNISQGEDIINYSFKINSFLIKEENNNIDET